MKKIWLLALNDVRRTARDRTSLVWMLVMPVALMWLFGNIGGGGSSGPPQISLSLVNNDDGWLSAAFIDELDDEQIRLSRLDPAEAATTERKVRTLVIPAGFTRGVLAGEQQTLRLEAEPGSNQEFGLAAQTHALRAIVRTLARLAEMSEVGQSGEVEAVQAARSEFDRLAERPQLVTLDVSSAGRGRPVPAGRAQSVPGMLTFTVLMMTLIYGGVFLTQEKEEGLLRRQAGLPLGRRRIFLGKLTGRMLIAAAQIAILVLVGRYVFGISWGHSLGGLLLVLLSYSFAVGGLTVLTGSLLRTPAQASSVGWILAMILAGLGGCWWPAEVMPRWMWSVAHALPTAWAMDAFHALISFGRGLDAVLLPSAVLAGFGVAFSAIGARFLRFE